MSIPERYRHSDKEFKSFLQIAQDRMGPSIESVDMAYAAVDGVLQVFRRRLTPPQVIKFGDALPATLRAMLVYGWQVDAVPLPFGSRSEMLREVIGLCKNQSHPPLHVIEATAYALWHHCNPKDLTPALEAIGTDAVAFWAVPGVDVNTLEQRSAPQD